MVFRPQAWPLARSASAQVMTGQSGAKISRAPQAGPGLRGEQLHVPNVGHFVP